MLKELGIKLGEVELKDGEVLVYSVIQHSEISKQVNHTYIIVYSENGEVDYFTKTLRKDYEEEANIWLGLHEYSNKLREESREQIKKGEVPTELYNKSIILDKIQQTDEEYNNAGWFWTLED